MIGSIAGDIIGSRFERHPIKTKDFLLFGDQCRFTDDTVLTVAISDAILSGRSYRTSLQEIGNRYPRVGYGASFIHWLQSENPQPYNSWGNGSAMRVSAVGFAFQSEADVLLNAKLTAQVSHDHPEGIKGAQAAALAVFLARTGVGKAQIKKRISDQFDYDLDRSVAGIRPDYAFDVSCQGSVPEAIVSFLDSDAYEDAVRNAISLGGDSDTLACIAGGIADAFYGVPVEIRMEVRKQLPPDLLTIVERFCQKYHREF